MNFGHLLSPRKASNPQVAALKLHADSQTEWWETVQRFQATIGVSTHMFLLVVKHKQSFY